MRLARDPKLGHSFKLGTSETAEFGFGECTQSMQYKCTRVQAAGRWKVVACTAQSRRLLPALAPKHSIFHIGECSLTLSAKGCAAAFRLSTSATYIGAGLTATVVSVCSALSAARGRDLHVWTSATAITSGVAVLRMPGRLARHARDCISPSVLQHDTTCRDQCHDSQFAAFRWGCYQICRHAAPESVQLTSIPSVCAQVLTLRIHHIRADHCGASLPQDPLSW